MITVLTIRELLLYTGLKTSESGRYDLGLSGLMGWDPRSIQNFSDEELEIFYRQWIALPEQIAKDLRITEEPSHFHVDDFTRLLCNGHERYHADFKSPRIIHSTSEFFTHESVTTSHEIDEW